MADLGIKPKSPDISLATGISPLWGADPTKTMTSSLTLTYFISSLIKYYTTNSTITNVIYDIYLSP